MIFNPFSNTKNANRFKLPSNLFMVVLNNALQFLGLVALFRKLIYYQKKKKHKNRLKKKNEIRQPRPTGPIAQPAQDGKAQPPFLPPLPVALAERARPDPLPPISLSLVPIPFP